MSTLRRYLDILKLAQKPSWEEFSKYSRLVVIGMALLGVIAFIVKIIMTLATLPLLG
jgi:protein translocase SEC61 complex gamma subunit